MALATCPDWGDNKRGSSSSHLCFSLTLIGAPSVGIRRTHVTRLAITIFTPDRSSFTCFEYQHPPTRVLSPNHSKQWCATIHALIDSSDRSSYSVEALVVYPSTQLFFNFHSSQRLKRTCRSAPTCLEHATRYFYSCKEKQLIKFNAINSFLQNFRTQNAQMLGRLFCHHHCHQDYQCQNKQ